MKVPKSQLKTLIKEVIAVVNEVDDPVDWSVEGDHLLSIEGLPLEDGRVISADVALNGEWESSGIGGYEFWGQKGFDKGTNQFSLNNYRVVNVVDDATEQPIWQAINKSKLEQTDKKLNDEIIGWVEENASAIENYINQNSPEDDGPPDHEPDNDWH